MPPPNRPTIPRKRIRFESQQYLVRSLGTDDASDRWAEWMSEPELAHAINAPERRWTKTDIAKYIETFDQRTVLLLGIFDKSSGAHIGIFTVDINPVTGQFISNMLIGEPDYRHKGVMMSLTVPYRDYFFEMLDLKVALGSVLARNAPVVEYLRKTGFQLDRTIKGGAKSRHGGEPLDLCLFSQSREAWRAWKKAHAGSS
jgi:RimJ/RimL family protein N-acetyltransferase